MPRSDISKNKIEQKLVAVRKKKEELAKIENELSLAEVKHIEDNLLRDSSEIVKDSLRFAEIAFDDKGEVISYPDEWNALSDSDRERKIRIAKANWMSSSDVPHGIKMAERVVLAITKSRKEESTNKHTLNIQYAQFTTPTPTRDLPVIEVEE
jgi:hypothetical protein